MIFIREELIHNVPQSEKDHKNDAKAVSIPDIDLSRETQLCALPEIPNSLTRHIDFAFPRSAAIDETHIRSCLK